LQFNVFMNLKGSLFAKPSGVLPQIYAVAAGGIRAEGPLLKEMVEKGLDDRQSKFSSKMKVCATTFKCAPLRY
jgi:hypothetical protein